MTQRIWHKGPPPHIGWWNASIRKDRYVWRWWNGKRWSCAACTDYPAWVAGDVAKLKTAADGVQWTDYWPKNARVPRSKP